VLLTKYLYLFIYTHNGYGTFQNHRELFEMLNILPVPYICVRTAVGKYICMCVYTHIMKIENYIKFNVGMLEQYLVMFRYNTCLRPNLHLYFIKTVS